MDSLTRAYLDWSISLVEPIMPQHTVDTNVLTAQINKILNEGTISESNIPIIKQVVGYIFDRLIFKSQNTLHFLKKDPHTHKLLHSFILLVQLPDLKKDFELNTKLLKKKYEIKNSQ